MVDAWLLKRFPGKTLEELDGMDWFRFLRAVEAEQIEAVEVQRQAALRNDATKLTEDEAIAIAEHDELMTEYGAE